MFNQNIGQYKLQYHTAKETLLSQEWNFQLFLHPQQPSHYQYYNYFNCFLTPNNHSIFIIIITFSIAFSSPNTISSLLLSPYQLFLDPQQPSHHYNYHPFNSFLIHKNHPIIIAITLLIVSSSTPTIPSLLLSLFQLFSHVTIIQLFNLYI